MSEPDPTMVLTVPAATPAAKIPAAVSGVTRPTLEGRGDRHLRPRRVRRRASARGVRAVAGDRPRPLAGHARRAWVLGGAAARRRHPRRPPPRGVLRVGRRGRPGGPGARAAGDDAPHAAGHGPAG